jgi:hypothetical protein
MSATFSGDRLHKPNLAIVATQAAKLEDYFLDCMWL